MHFKVWPFFGKQIFFLLQTQNVGSKLGQNSGTGPNSMYLVCMYYTLHGIPGQDGQYGDRVSEVRNNLKVAPSHRDSSGQRLPRLDKQRRMQLSSSHETIQK